MYALATKTVNNKTLPKGLAKKLGTTSMFGFSYLSD
jgi:hypothetical protein